MPRLMTGNGSAGGPAGPAGSLPPPPPPPGTPGRLHGEAIDEHIRSLERKWSLGLRIRCDVWSPATRKGDLADKTYGLVQRLYYLPPALDNAIKSFEKLARQWPRNKPQRQRLEELYRTLQNEVKRHTPEPTKNNPLKSLLPSSLHGQYTPCSRIYT